MPDTDDIASIHHATTCLRDEYRILPPQMAATDTSENATPNISKPEQGLPGGGIVIYEPLGLHKQQGRGLKCEHAKDEVISVNTDETYAAKVEASSVRSQELMQKRGSMIGRQLPDPRENEMQQNEPAVLHHDDFAYPKDEQRLRDGELGYPAPPEFTSREHVDNSDPDKGCTSEAEQGASLYWDHKGDLENKAHEVSDVKLNYKLWDAEKGVCNIIDTDDECASIVSDDVEDTGNVTTINISTGSYIRPTVENDTDGLDDVRNSSGTYMRPVARSDSHYKACEEGGVDANPVKFYEDATLQVRGHISVA